MYVEFRTADPPESSDIPSKRVKMSTLGSAGSSGPGQGHPAPSSDATEPLSFFPAGLQLLYDVEKANVLSLKHAFFLATHWIMIRGGLRRTTTPLNLPGSYETRRAITTSAETPAGSSAAPSSPTEPTTAQVLAAITETPEPGWAERINGVLDAPVIFTYMNPLALEEGYYKLEFYALNDTDMIVRLTNPHAPFARKHFLEKKPDMVHGQSDNKSSQASSYVMSDFVRFGEEVRTALEVFYKVPLLEKTVFKNMFERMGLPVNGVIPKSIGIYDDAPTTQQQTTENRTRDTRSGYYRDEPNPYRPQYPTRPLPDPGGLGGPL